MLIEFYNWSTASSAPAARKAGLVAEVAGIAGRYQRHTKAWKPHLQQTSDFIKQNLSHADPQKPILVLGAGLCLDLPLKALNSHPAGCLFVDAVLSLSVRLKLQKYRNIKFQVSDLTGFLKPFWESRLNEAVSPPEIAPFPNGDFGMVISCNLLSQLPLSFASSPPANDIEMRLTAAIQLAHVRALNALTCPLMLITDYERLESKDDVSTTIPTIAPQILPGDPHAEWEWHIAPNGEIAAGQDVTLKVGAWLLSSC